MTAFRVRVVPGSALIARSGDGALVVRVSDAAHGEAIEALLDTLAKACAGEDPAPGEQLTRELVRTVAARSPEEVPPFAAVAPGRGGLAVLLAPGTELAWDDADERHHLLGRDATTWLDRVIPWEVGRVVVGLEPLPTADPPPFADLRDGVVSGDAAVVDLLDAAPADEDATTPTPATEARPPEAPPRAAESQPAGPLPAPFEVVDLAEPSALETRDPLPVGDEVDGSGQSVVDPAVPTIEPPAVDGVHCVRGHFNHPHARYCAICGISFQQQTVNVVEGPRPPLGIVVVDDGSTFTLDADYIIGREPELAPEVVGGRARALALADPERSVSRLHAEIRLEDWDVRLTDRGSANGSFVLAPGEPGWAQVPAREPVTLRPGTRVAVGQRTFVYESHHLPG